MQQGLLNEAGAKGHLRLLHMRSHINERPLKGLLETAGAAYLDRGHPEIIAGIDGVACLLCANELYCPVLHDVQHELSTRPLHMRPMQCQAGCKPVPHGLPRFPV